MSPAIDGLSFRVGTYDSLAKCQGWPITIYICSGFVRALQVHEESGDLAVVTFARTNIATIARQMHERYPKASIVVDDNGQRHSFENNSECAFDEAPAAPRCLRELQLQSAEEAFDYRTRTVTIGKAEKLLNWIDRRRLTAVERSTILRMGPGACRDAQSASGALALLVALGWLETQDDKHYRVSKAAKTDLKLVDALPSADVNNERSLVKSDCAA